MSNTRKWINRLHLWIGLPCGLILFIVCLSGTIYVFNREIVQWVDSDKFRITVPQGQPILPLTQLVTRVEQERNGYRVSAIQIPEDKATAWTFTVRSTMPQDTASAPRADRSNPKRSASPAGREQNRAWLVDPYTGHIQGDAQTTAWKFFNTIMGLHRWLLMDHDTGKVITGIASLLFLLLEITGLLLWLPKLKSWKRWPAWKPGLQVKRDAHWKRTNHDLHKTLGFYSFLFVTIMALTGPALAFDWYRDGFSRAFGITPAKKEARNMASRSGTTAASSRPGPSASRPNQPSQAAAGRIADSSSANPPTPHQDSIYQQSLALLPYPGDTRLNFPRDKAPSFTIMRTHTGFFSSAAIDRILFNRNTGRMEKLERYSDKRWNQKIVSSIKYIHTGEIFGGFSKIIWFLACLIATSLPLTGTLIWWNKRRKKPAQKNSLTSGQAKKEFEFNLN